MRWQRRELAVLKSIEIEEELHIAPSLFASNTRLNEIKDVWVNGIVRYDNHQDLLYVDIVVEGLMICPCAITNEDVDYNFNIEYSEVFSFKQAEEYSVANIDNEELNLDEVVIDLVMQEIPLKVVKEGQIDYPKGNGWLVTTEADYAKQKEEEIDSRLAVLKNYQFNDKEE